MARRSYGTGSLQLRVDRNGRETWYAQWRSNGRRVKRAIGPKRADGSRDGLTRTQAEAELRRLMAETPASKQQAHVTRRTLADVAARYLAHLKAKGRKRAT